MRARVRGGDGGAGSPQAVATRPSSVFDQMFASDPFVSDPFFSPFFGRGGFGAQMGPAAAADMSPALDISETPTHFLVKAELPGIKKEDVKITLHDGLLTIEAEKQKREESGEDKEETKVHYSEFSWGKMSRTLRLPDTVDPNDVTGEMQDGVLKVSIKRAEHAQPKQIDIK